MPDINSGLIDFLLHPPVGALGMHLDYNGPFSGNVELTEWSNVPGPVFAHLPVSNTFGAIVQLNGSIPSGWGQTLGWFDNLGLYSENIYEDRLVQFVVQHQLLSGSWVSTQVIDIRTFPTMVLWDVALPGRLGLYVAPGIAFDLFFLLVN